MTSRHRPPEAIHGPILSRVLSSHRTTEGTLDYVRCTCGGFVVLSTPCRGAPRQVSHAAGRAG